MRRRLRPSSSLVWLAILTTIFVAPSASAIGLWGPPINLNIVAFQVETGGDTSPNPDVTGGAAGPLVPYVPTGSFVFDPEPVGSGPTGLWGPENLNDGDVGDGIPSDGFYAIVVSNSTVRLNFGEPVTLGSLAIYPGYNNRDDGQLFVRDDLGTLHGAFFESTAECAPLCNNEGVVSYWLVFDTPITTSYLDLETTCGDSPGNCPSFREIQVFGLASSVPSLSPWFLVVACATLLASGVLMARSRRSA